MKHHRMVERLPPSFIPSLSLSFPTSKYLSTLRHCSAYQGLETRVSFFPHGAYVSMEEANDKHVNKQYNIKENRAG